MLGVFETIGAWLRAVPGPTEHWATIISALAWPIAALLITFMLRNPITRAADKLADRFENDDIEVPGFLKITGNVPVSTLKEGAVTEQPGSPEEEDAKIIESLFEYAGEAHENVDRLLEWIGTEFGFDFDAEAFLSERGFAEQRKRAYLELVKEAGR